MGAGSEAMPKLCTLAYVELSPTDAFARGLSDGVARLVVYGRSESLSAPGEPFRLQEAVCHFLESGIVGGDAKAIGIDTGCFAQIAVLLESSGELDPSQHIGGVGFDTPAKMGDGVGELALFTLQDAHIQQDLRAPK